jgi:hypothetical protein
MSVCMCTLVNSLAVGYAFHAYSMLEDAFQLYSNGTKVR